MSNLFLLFSRILLLFCQPYIITFKAFNPLLKHDNPAHLSTSNKDEKKLKHQHVFSSSSTCLRLFPRVFRLSNGSATCYRQRKSCSATGKLLCRLPEMINRGAVFQPQAWLIHLIAYSYNLICLQRFWSSSQDVTNTYKLQTI